MLIQFEEDLARGDYYKVELQLAGMFSCIRNVLLFPEYSPVSGMFSCIRNVLLYPECSPVSRMFSCIRNVLLHQECSPVSVLVKQSVGERAPLSLQ